MTRSYILFITAILEFFAMGDPGFGSNQGLNIDFNGQDVKVKVGGQTKSGYKISSHFFFSVRKNNKQIIPSNLTLPNYLDYVSFGLEPYHSLPTDDSIKTLTIESEARFPCLIQELISQLKKVESKAAQSGEESDVAEFSALLFKSPKGLTFKRRVTLGSAQNKDHLIRGFGLQGEPLWSLSESLTGFNQLVLEGAFNAYLLPEQINHDSYPPGFYPVIGEVSITIDNDAINLESNLKKDSKLREKLIAKLLGETVKIFFDGAISIDRLIPMVGKHLRGRNLGAFEYQCMPPTSETANSIMNGVPRFAEGYLRNLEYFLQSHL